MSGERAVPDDHRDAIHALISEKYCYYHQWSEGELLLLDNRRALHGREPFKGQRSLVNIQVIADAQTSRP
jgi:alpha-ketoglutarate-dependent taurine dioxygenase